MAKKTEGESFNSLVVKNTFLTVHDGVPQQSSMFYRQVSCPPSTQSVVPPEVLGFTAEDFDDDYEPEGCRLASTFHRFKSGSDDGEDEVSRRNWQQQQQMHGNLLRAGVAEPGLANSGNAPGVWPSSMHSTLYGGHLGTRFEYPGLAVADPAEGLPALGQGFPPVAPDDFVEAGDFADKPTVMMRNLPNKYTQALLLDEINTAGFIGTFDFFYLPIDVRTNANKGYAFINFVDARYAKRFQLTYEGCQMLLFRSSKQVSVTAATCQGFEANYAHYYSARCNQGDPSARPLFFRGSSAAPLLRQEQKMQQAKQKQKQQGRKKVKFCPYCGVRVGAGFCFCAQCGKNLDV